MENPTSLHDSTERAGSEPAGVPGVVSRYAATVHHSKATSDYPFERDSVAKECLAPEEQRLTEGSNAELNHQVSNSIHLEPPPVIMRPPKFKSDDFNVDGLSWFSWNRTEQKDVLQCVRSTQWSYYYQTTFRFFGFNISKNITYKTSEGGIDAATENVRLGWWSSETNWVRDKLPKARARIQKSTGREQSDAADGQSQSVSRQDQGKAADIEGQNESGQGPPSAAHPWLHEHYYVVVGFMGDESVPKENLRRVVHTDGLFQQIRKAHRYLRNPLRRALSLKEVSGFGVYECDPTKGYHREVELDKGTERALAELWRNYSGHTLDYEGRWLMWIHQHFNNGSKKPEMGRLTLEFKLRWSVYKVIFWGIVPILLSLTIGFWYIYSDHPGIDDVAVTEAAWVIATYIITTSALLLALLAVITQFGDV